MSILATLCVASWATLFFTVYVCTHAHALSHVGIDRLLCRMVPTCLWRIYKCRSPAGLPSFFSLSHLPFSDAPCDSLQNIIPQTSMRFVAFWTAVLLFAIRCKSLVSHCTLVLYIYSNVFLCTAYTSQVLCVLLFRMWKPLNLSGPLQLEHF